ncbi:MAG: hypothetical protein WKF59_03420 [Chitinophagaceae bacterium]
MYEILKALSTKPIISLLQGKPFISKQSYLLASGYTIILAPTVPKEV